MNKSGLKICQSAASRFVGKIYGLFLVLGEYSNSQTNTLRQNLSLEEDMT